MTPHDLIAAFDVLAEAPDGVKRLRELVLQLAVRGKLVPQDPGDEPASNRLLLAQRDVERHGEAGHFRGQPVDWQLPEACSGVPAGWASVRLEHVAGRRSGNSKLIKGKLHAQPSAGYFQGYSASGPDVWLDFYEHEGTGLVLSAVGARCGKCFLATGKWSAVANTHIVWPFESVVWPDFLMLHLNNERFWLRAGGAQPFVKVTDSFAQTILLPPLAEQHRIVARVDELMGLLDRLEAAREAREGTRAALRDATLAALRNADSAEEVEVAWQRVAEGMDDLFTDPADVKPLREAVLQLAVRGKLVPQDPGDEPATVLLERITAEKARLVKEGKIRKSEPLAPVSPDEVPFDVPEGWEWTRVGTVCATQTGATPKKELEDAPGPTILYVKPADLGTMYVGRGVQIARAAAEDSGRVAEAGSVLFVGIGGSIGKCGLILEPATFNQQIHAATPVMIAPGYLQVVLASPRFQSFVAEMTSATAIPIVNKSRWEGSPIPLPPLSGQHRIVAKVDELMALFDRLEQRLVSQRDLHDAFAAAAVHHLDA